MHRTTVEVQQPRIPSTPLRNTPAGVLVILALYHMTSLSKRFSRYFYGMMIQRLTRKVLIRANHVSVPRIQPYD